MRPSVVITPLIPWLALLASCSTPPKPPTVDETKRRPVNAQAAVDLQICKGELQNARLMAAEAGRAAETNAATLANLAARQQELIAMQAASSKPAPANAVFTVRFDYGSTRVSIPPSVGSALVDEAKASPLVLLRGRTDGTSDTSAESRIARDRAGAVRDYLVAAGVDAARIRATFQPSGDHVADNTNAVGRGQNRRVEVELYRVPPVALLTTALAQP